MTKKGTFFYPVPVLICAFLIAYASPVISFQGMISDGSDGPFHPTHDTQLDLLIQNLFNFTSITIPDGVTVSFKNASDSTPVYFLATEEIVIDGRLRLNANGRNGGPAGFDGGVGGAEASPGENGFGSGGGNGGIARHPGGGGGFATSGGATKKDGCLSQIIQGGSFTPYDPDLFNGGSGGGGGGGGNYGVNGCFGGGGGGALLLSTPASITIGGYIDMRGAGGEWCYTSALCGIRGGPGGGGAGGMVRIEGGTVTVESDATVNCSGGKGGVRSSDGTLTPFGGNGGYGYIALHSPEWQLYGNLHGILVINDCVADLDNDGDVDGADNVIMADNMDVACLEYFALSLGAIY